VKAHCVAYAAKDPDKSAEFYAKILGCSFLPRPKNLDYTGYWMASFASGFKTEIIHAKKQELAVGKYCLNYDHQAFYVTDMHKTKEILQHHQLEYVSTRCHKGGAEHGDPCCIVLKDPDQNTILLLPEPDDKQKHRFSEIIEQSSSFIDELKNKRKHAEIQELPQHLENLEQKTLKEKMFLPITRLAFTARVAADVEESARFYCELGFERQPIPDWAHLDGLLVGHPQTGLMVWLVPGYHVMQPDVEAIGKAPPPLDLVGQLSLLVQDIEGWKKYLQCKNLQFRECTKPVINLHCLFFKDPVGHIVELVSFEDETKAPEQFQPPKEIIQRLNEIAKIQKDVIKGHQEMQVGA
jgi:catechol 2,3-dioxygenase-like lactoylglutathione lyase family enzyme